MAVALPFPFPLQFRPWELLATQAKDVGRFSGFGLGLGLGLPPGACGGTGQRRLFAKVPGAKVKKDKSGKRDAVEMRRLLEASTEFGSRTKEQTSGKAKPKIIEQVAMLDQDRVVQQIEGPVTNLMRKLESIQLGKADTTTFESFVVELPGSEKKVLSDIAQVAVMGATTVQVTVFEDSHVTIVRSFLNRLDTSWNVSLEGKVKIKILMPPITAELRDEKKKKVKAELEQAKVAVRGVREALMKQAKRVSVVEQKMRDEKLIAASLEMAYKKMEKLAADKMAELSR